MSATAGLGSDATEHQEFGSLTLEVRNLSLIDPMVPTASLEINYGDLGGLCLVTRRWTTMGQELLRVSEIQFR